ncbi:MAG: HAD family hydrolase, partial [Actinomycetota bacterium]
MSVRFDAILFDAGGILLLPDPITIGTVIRECGGDGSIEKLIRSHYAGMAAIDAGTRHTEGMSIEKFGWDSYRAAYVQAAGVPQQQREVAAVKLRDLFSPFLWRFPLLNSTAALWRLHLKQVPIGVVSNASGQIEQTLANQCVCQVGPGAGVPVLIVTDSRVIGVSKPNPDVFADAIALL